MHVVGMGEVWGRELPGIATRGGERERKREEGRERMKIAWRYEGRGVYGRERERGALCVFEFGINALIYTFLAGYVNVFLSVCRFFDGGREGG